jgi:hypothetical protein
MTDLKQKFQSEKNITESSANEYMRRLTIANCGKPFSDLKFLKDKSQVLKCLEKYKQNTKKNILTAIVSVCKLMKDSKMADMYYDDMMKAEPPKSSEKTETQKENWMDWTDVMELKAKLKKTQRTWEDRTKYFLLCLYTEIPPRRNADYLLMDVVEELTPDLPKNRNYLVLKDRHLVFNSYKTSKKYGTQTLDIPPELSHSILDYLEHHPHIQRKVFPLFVNTYGTPYKTSAFITHTLNRMFGRKIGPSMLRHIYLSHKYDIGDMERTAEAMGHSVSEQRDYLRK